MAKTRKTKPSSTGRTRARARKAAAAPTTAAAKPTRAARKPRATPKAAPATVKVAAAKGRPMLVWVGKRPLGQVQAFPAQHVEQVALPAHAELAAAEAELQANARKEGVARPDPWAEWPATYPKGGLLFHGDNKEVLAHLLANGFRGKVNLVYIDPPFDSGADYVRKVSLRGPIGTAKIDGESYTLGEQIQYTDIWANDTYLQFMYERLLLLRELLSTQGVLWLHCDSARGHSLKLVADEVMGSEAFVNQIVWKRSDAHSDVGQGAKHFGTVHDMLLVYRKGDRPVWNDAYSPLSEKTKRSWYRNVEEGTGKLFNKADITGPGGAIKGNPVYEWRGITKAWRYSRQRMEELEAAGLLVYSESGMPYRKRYLDESKGVPLQDWWDDIQMVRGIQRRGDGQYPTEKPPELLQRILEVNSNPGDLVLDCFIGSGTTAAVAQKLGRRWIGCDINKGAIQTTAKRLLGVMEAQAAERRRAREAAARQVRLPGMVDDNEPPPAAPAQLAFSTWRVNDYDLQIQHNEAVALACEHLGVERSRSDRYFDGTLGKKLVKIIPFDHPLSPLDIEEVKREVEARRDEDRDIALVCLGVELAAQQVIDDWNRHRKGRGAINRLDVIELRTDAKYGGVLQHHPASARVTVRRARGVIHVEVTDFISPSIVERLRQQAGVLQPRIDDWRAMVDSVMIDPAYDGTVFNVALADVPARKTDLVGGRYEVPAPDEATTVAVKITDMLGEEVLFTQQV
ncbi:MAG: site-specific DNA-methyltransferase [Vicinamibacterales bacterium]